MVKHGIWILAVALSTIGSSLPGCSTPKALAPDASDGALPLCESIGCGSDENLFCNRSSTDSDGERESKCGCPQPDGKIVQCYRLWPPPDAGVAADAKVYEDGNALDMPRIDAP